MRVLALADAPPRHPIPDLVAALDPELILLLGDLEPAWTEGLADVPVTKLGVLGNHDEPGALTALGVTDLHLTRASAGGLSFAGFGGSPRYRKSGERATRASLGAREGSDRNEWTEEEAAAMLEDLPGADVLLAHSPPAGVNDEPDDPVHTGSPALLRWVQRHEPAVLLHGHTLPHPARRTTRVGATRVVHVRGSLPLDLP